MYAMSPLRYPGAKWKIAGFVEALLRRNELIDAHYIEPYAGGASLALSLLFRHAVSQIHLNDLDRSIYAFWKSTLDYNEELTKRILKTRVTPTEWRRQKEVQRNLAKADIFDLGFSTFFLNRTNRSGILNAGMIGGKAQTGEWKIDARYNIEELVYRLQRVGQRRTQISVTNLDAVKLLKRIASDTPKKSLIYLDPPYFAKGQDLYLNAYSPEDHRVVRDTVIEKLTTPWMVSYDDVPEIRKLYRGMHKRKHYLNYSAFVPRDATEVLFFSQDLKIPSIN